MSTGPQQFIRLSEEPDGRSTMTNIQLSPDIAWPPPEVIYTIAPHGMGWTQAVVSLDGVAIDELAAYIMEPGNEGCCYTVTPWRRVACSKLDDATVEAGSFVARGADYVPISVNDNETEGEIR